MKRGRWLGLLLITGLALALRLPDLGNRPLHNDEAVNATKLRDLWLHGQYRYDPDEYHGPTLHYASLPFVRLSGARDYPDLTEARLRLVTVAAGVALILLTFLLAEGLGWPAALLAAVFLAISPAMVFYSRYFIHEMLLVAATALSVGAGWRWWTSQKLRWAVATGLGVGLMYATKETFVFNLAAMAAASGATFLWQRSNPGDAVDSNEAEVRRTLWRGIPVILLTAVIVGALLFTSFFTNLHGLRDSFVTYAPWLKRAGGASPHLHPWWFYFERLLWFHQPKGRVWSEGLLFLLALAGVIAGVFGRGGPRGGVWLVRWLSVYSVALTGIYCAIPYKTPWCALGFLHGWILLAGVGGAVCWQWARHQVGQALLVLLLGGAAVQLAWQSWQASQMFFAAKQNPYVYAQTSAQFRDLVDRIEGIASVAPSGHDLVIKVIASESDYWPLPYYLRRFSHTGWYSAFDDPEAPVIVTSAGWVSKLDERLKGSHLLAQFYELRPGTSLALYVELDLWKRYVATLPRPKE